MKTPNNYNFSSFQKLFFILLFSTLFGSLDLYSQSYGREFDITVKNYNYFFNLKDFDKAEDQAKLAHDFAIKSKNKEAQGYALTLEAKALMHMTKRESKNMKNAKKALETSLVLIASTDNNELKRENYQLLKTLAVRNGDNVNAVIYEEKLRDMSLIMSKKVEERKLTKQKRDLESKLDHLNKDVSDLSSAKDISEKLLVEQRLVSDSLFTQSKLDSMLMVQQESAILQQKNQLELQESQLSLQKSQRNFSFALAGIALLLLIGMVLRYFETSKHNAVLQAKNEIIVNEKKRSEELLLNILPSLVANELKVSGIAQARSYESASVLFTDFVKFSEVAQSLKPEELVSVLDFYFSSFDEIISQFNVEKIKTIGDSYMVASGLPVENKENPLEIVKAAIAIQEFTIKAKKDRMKKNLPYFDARIGVHTGPLVAGVVGHKKFAYDIWGDTVNVASRMETNCDPGRVNISASTYEFIKEHYKFEFRGIIPVKNRDDVGMYYIKA